MKYLRKIAFIVERFPVISETWLIQQIGDLIENGYEVRIFAFLRGDESDICQLYYDLNMKNLVIYVPQPPSGIRKIFVLFSSLISILSKKPRILLRVLLNPQRFFYISEKINLLIRVVPFLELNFDLIHCHFGKVANRFLPIRQALGDATPFVTSFYGFDVSNVFKEKPAEYYDKLKQECSRFIVMTNNMKERIIQHGFPQDKVAVIPVAIETNKYPFKERSYDKKTVNLLSVGRLIEKKGFDDLLRALSIVRDKSRRKFKCDIYGGGELELKLKQMVKDLSLADVVSFRGYIKNEKLVKKLFNYQILIQPSKTASNGDME